MKLICEKYKEELEPGNIRCPHPDDYCKWRESCIVCFRWKEEQKFHKKHKKEKEQKKE
ncbi:MAG: hypothetical protein R6V20_01305 [Desulfobia sp.]